MGTISESLNLSTPPRQPYPAVSVIIPMYNVEKYIGECLESILAQTFQNFEVIVVDDCSTDSSCAVVKNYMEKFGGRLALKKTQKNSGGAGFPRNKGIELARGEYIYFFDPDDTISSTTLEEFYTLAKKYDADVVSCERFFEIPDEIYNDARSGKDLSTMINGRGNNFVTEPTLLTTDISERIISFYRGYGIYSVVLKFFRRKFILDNKIKFLNCFSEDLIFTSCVLCTAKNYLLIPNIFYYYRKREGFAMTAKMEVSTFIKRQLHSLKSGFEYVDKFLSKKEFFSRQPDLKYFLFELINGEFCSYLTPIYSQIDASLLDKALKKEFSDGNNLALTSFIFSKMNIQNLQLRQIESQFRQFVAQHEAFEKKTQTRIDELKKSHLQIKLTSRNLKILP